MVVKAHVVEVVDGDTFRTNYTIRLESVDAPEIN
jgi:endonuclease YncB( thermonuclease family)